MALRSDDLGTNLEMKKFPRENLYEVGDKVWVSEWQCFATIEAVRRPAGNTYYRYDLTLDDKSTASYVQEHMLYPVQEHAKS